MKNCSCGSCYEVTLNGSNTPYPHLRFRFDEAYADRNVYFVHAIRLVKAHQNFSTLTIKPCADWDQGLYTKVCGDNNPVLLNPREKHALMPRLTVNEYATPRKRSIIDVLFGRRVEPIATIDITFGNGRHRTYFAAHHGAEFLPVQMREESAHKLATIIGQAAVQLVATGTSSAPPPP